MNHAVACAFCGRVAIFMKVHHGKYGKIVTCSRWRCKRAGKRAAG